MATIESTFNLSLGDALRTTSARWSDQQNFIRVEETNVIYGSGNRGKRPDILVLDKVSPPVVIECSFDGNDADRDAEARLGLFTRTGQLKIKSAVSVYIPNRFRNLQMAGITAALRGGQSINYALHQLVSDVRTDTSVLKNRRWPTRGFLPRTAQDLAAFLPAAALPKEEVERVADKVAMLVKAAAMGLEGAGASRKNSGGGNLSLHQRSSLSELRTTMVVWLNALLTQQRLRVQGVAGIPPVKIINSSSPLLSEQVKVWRAIRERNWRSIFEPAVDRLESLGNADPSATAQALGKLIKAVEQIEVARLGLHINVGAELFPKLSEDRKEAAAFYTQPATAELLAHLTVRNSALPANEWVRGDLFRNRRLADFACGTGTLLRAGYRRIADFHERAGGTKNSVPTLHKGAMEWGLVGTDVSPIAAHLTTSSLAAIGAGEAYGETQIGWVNVGEKRAWTGSLEFLAAEQMYDMFDSGAGRSAGGHRAENSVVAPDGGMDWILMNPPYSRTRGGQSAFDIAGLSETERKACQARWRSLVRAHPANNQEGMASSFLALARAKDRRGGRIGFVLPLTAAFAESWSVSRRMIEREFKNVIAIAVAAGQALGKDAMSADTGMEEMLLVCTRHENLQSEGKPSPIHCVTLAHPVTRVGEAGEIAGAIASTIKRLDRSTAHLPIRAGRDEIGHVCVFRTDGEGAPWGPLGAKRADLAFAADALTRGRLEFDECSISLGLGMQTLGDIFKVGPTHHLIGHLRDKDPIGAFEFTPITGPVDAIGADRALWSADSKEQQKLVILPTHKGSAPAGVGSSGRRQNMRQFRSTLSYARNMRWTSQPLMAATTKNAGMGGSTWTTLGHKDERVRKAFALWANSTLGMLIQWTQGQRTHAGRSRVQIKALTQIPCPQLDQLPGDVLDQAAMDFDRLATQKLCPACQAYCDPVRKNIDAAVLRLLSISEEATATVNDLRWLWCNEPSVHGRNRKALALLEKKNASD